MPKNYFVLIIVFNKLNLHWLLKMRKGYIILSKGNENQDELDTYLKITIRKIKVHNKSTN